MLAVLAKRLIDGRNISPLDEPTVLIEEQNILAIGQRDDIEIPDEAEIVRLPSSTLMPGLIDAHVHITNNGGKQNAWKVLGDIETSFATLALQGAANAKKSLLAGYTTLRNLNAFGYADVALRDALADGSLEGSRLLVCGQGLCITGGHMDQVNLPLHVSATGRIGITDSPEGFRQAVRAHVKMGVDLIKINSDVGSSYDLSTPWCQEMSFDEMKAACDEAHKFNRRVAAHTTGGPPIEDAILAGVNSVEHGHWLTPKAIELMLEHGTFYVPTLVVNNRNFDQGDIDGKKIIGESPSAWARLSFEAKWDSLERAHAAGVKIVAGSDAGFIVDHGENAEEIVELVRGGLSPMEGIQAATANAAELLDIADEVGTIESGKRADIVAIDGDPLMDISILCDHSLITHVVQAGTIVKEPINRFKS